MHAVEKATAEMLLKRGVRYKIPASRFFRFLGRKNTSITLKPLFMGTELELALIGLSVFENKDNVTDADIAAYMAENYYKVVRYVAIASINNKWLIRLFTWYRMIQLNRMTVWQLFELYVKIREINSSVPFITITRSANMMRITKPTQGQTEKGS